MPHPRVPPVNADPPPVQPPFLPTIEEEEDVPALPTVSKSQSNYALNMQHEVPVPTSHLQLLKGTSFLIKQPWHFANAVLDAKGYPQSYKQLIANDK